MAGLDCRDGRLRFERYRVRRRISASSASPTGTDASLVNDLLGIGCIPVVASIGVDPDGVLLNVNADVLAGHLAAILPARRLIIAGGTAGVLDANGQMIGALGVGRNRRDDGVGRRPLGNGGKTRRLSSRVFGRRDRYINRGGAGSGRLRERHRYRDRN